MIFFGNLKKQKEIVSGVLERKDGSFNPFSNPKSTENILKALPGFSVDNLIFAQQTRSTNVFVCPPKVGGYIKLETDGLISQNAGQVLVIKTADCVPILVFDPENKKIAALHIGRQGLAGGIIDNFFAQIKGRPSSFLFGIGPHIRKCCYFLRGEGLALAGNKCFKKYVEEREEKLFFDLSQAVLNEILKHGAEKENIEDCGICTFCQADRFFSSRKRQFEPAIYSKENERFPCFGSFIGLKKK